MPLKIKCPEGHELVVPTQRAGLPVRCPICKRTVIVPNLDAATLARLREKQKKRRAEEAAKAVQRASEPKKPVTQPKPKRTISGATPTKQEADRAAKPRPSPQRVEPQKKPLESPKPKQAPPQRRRLLLQDEEPDKTDAPKAEPKPSPQRDRTSKPAEQKPATSGNREEQRKTGDALPKKQTPPQEKRAPAPKPAEPEPKEELPTFEEIQPSPKKPKPLPPVDPAKSEAAAEMPQENREREPVEKLTRPKPDEKPKETRPAAANSKEPSQQRVKEPTPKPTEPKPIPKKELRADDRQSEEPRETKPPPSEPKPIVAKSKDDSDAKAAQTSPAKSPPPRKKQEPERETREQPQSKPAAVPPPKPERASSQETKPSTDRAPKKPEKPKKPEIKKSPKQTAAAGPPALPPTKSARPEPSPAKTEPRPSRTAPQSKATPDKPTKTTKPKPDEQPKVRGVEHDPAKKWAVYYLSMGLAAVAVLTIIPGLIEVVSANSGEAARPVGTWAFWTMFIGLMQLLYVAYLAQVPDWSSVWVVAILNLAITTFYATMMGLLLMNQGDSPIVRGLDLLNSPIHDIHKKAKIWCVSMLSVSSLFTYLSGRIGLRWQKTYKLKIAATEAATDH